MTENIKKITSSNKKLTWYSIEHLSEAELKFLENNFKFHHLDFEDCMSEIQRPKIEEYEDYIFLILNVPRKSSKGKYIKKSQAFFFIGENFMITLNKGDKVIKKAFQNSKKDKNIKDSYMAKGSGYLLYMLIDDLFDSGFPIVDDIEKHLEKMEKEVFSPGQSQDKLREILALKKDIINFRRTIMPERSIIAMLEHKNDKIIPASLGLYFDDIVDKIEKMWNNLENLQELVNSLQETNESIISHNTNNIIRVLTIFSVVLLPLTFITGFYGMNVKGLPFATNTSSTIIVSLILVTVLLSMVGFFRFKKWL